MVKGLFRKLRAAFKRKKVWRFRYRRALKVDQLEKYVNNLDDE